MFGRKKKNQLHNHIDTLIGINTNIHGDIAFSGGLRVDGHVTGNVISSGKEQNSTLVLSKDGCITGTIRVTHVIINGTVNGPIYAQGYLELQAKAKVYGDIHYGSLEIQLGAMVEGKMIHQQAKPQTENEKQSEKMVTLFATGSEKQTEVSTDSRLTRNSRTT